MGEYGEFFSDIHAIHVEKGITQRVVQGLHLGAIAFGYDPCWIEVDGEKRRICSPEHQGGIHIHPEEGPAVQQLFKEYAGGATTLSQLAVWLNDQGFRTRNRHKFQDDQGNLVSEPRLFTLASIRGILHNPFYTGQVKHKDQLLPGVHEPLISQNLFDTVQATLRYNAGRSSTLTPRPAREYLLKGLIKCAPCGLSMWAQTYYSGNQYYREQRGSRGAGCCVNQSRSLPCHVPSVHPGRIVGAIILPDAWQDRLLAQVKVAKDIRRVGKERKEAEQRLRRLGQVYLDGLIEQEEYRRQKRDLDEKLRTLVIPEVDAATAAGELVENLPAL